MKKLILVLGFCVVSFGGDVFGAESVLPHTNTSAPLPADDSAVKAAEAEVKDSAKSNANAIKDFKIVEKKLDAQQNVVDGFGDKVGGDFQGELNRIASLKGEDFEKATAHMDPGFSEVEKRDFLVKDAKTGLFADESKIKAATDGLNDGASVEERKKKIQEYIDARAIRDALDDVFVGMQNVRTTDDPDQYDASVDKIYENSTRYMDITGKDLGVSPAQAVESAEGVRKHDAAKRSLRVAYEKAVARSIRELARLTGEFRVDALSVGTEKYWVAGDMSKDKNNIINQLIKLVAQFLGTLGVLLLVAGGVVMVFAHGDENLLQRGKTLLTYTALGLIIGFLSYTIVQLVISFVFEVLE